MTKVKSFRPKLNIPLMTFYTCREPYFLKELSQLALIKTIPPEENFLKIRCSSTEEQSLQAAYSWQEETSTSCQQGEPKGPAGQGSCQPAPLPHRAQSMVVAGKDGQLDSVPKAASNSQRIFIHPLERYDFSVK